MATSRQDNSGSSYHSLYHLNECIVILTIVYGPHAACTGARLLPSEPCGLRQGSVGQRDRDSGPPGHTDRISSDIIHSDRLPGKAVHI